MFVHCLSICLSCTGIVSKWLNVSSDFFQRRVATPFKFPYRMLWQYSGGDLPSGVSYAREYEKIAILTDISLYLGNDTRYGHSYCGMQIGNCTQAFKWYHFKWSWVTHNRNFKVTPLFGAECLRNGTRYRQWQWNTNMEWLTHALIKMSFQMILSDLEWLNEIFSEASCSLSLCDSWAC